MGSSHWRLPPYRLFFDRTSGRRTTVIEDVEALSSFTVVGDRLVGHTTLDAPRGRVVTAPVRSPTAEYWRTVVPESGDVIQGVAVTERSLLVASTRVAVSRLHFLPLPLERADGGGPPVDGPPVERRNACAATSVPANVFSPGFVLKLHSSPAGKS